LFRYPFEQKRYASKRLRNQVLVVVDVFLEASNKKGEDQSGSTTRLRLTFFYSFLSELLQRLTIFLEGKDIVTFPSPLTI
jgi:hypothetical protein